MVLLIPESQVLRRPITSLTLLIAGWKDVDQTLIVSLMLLRNEALFHE